MDKKAGAAIAVLLIALSVASYYALNPVVPMVSSSSPGYALLAPVTISWGVQVYDNHGNLVGSNFLYNKTIINKGLDQMSYIFGDSKAKALTGFVYMEASTATAVTATDTSCPSGLTTNGFTVYDTTANFARTNGSATTYTTFGTWTFTGTSTTVYLACLTASSTNAANFLADETLLNGATGYFLQTNYVLKLTLTVTV